MQYAGSSRRSRTALPQNELAQGWTLDHMQRGMHSPCSHFNALPAGLMIHGAEKWPAREHTCTEEPARQPSVRSSVVATSALVATALQRRPPTAENR